MYRRTDSDTLYNIRPLKEQFATSHKSERRPICALLTEAPALQSSSQLKKVEYLCSAEIYHEAFDCVRQAALSGKELDELQEAIDGYTAGL